MDGYCSRCRIISTPRVIAHIGMPRPNIAAAPTLNIAALNMKRPGMTNTKGSKPCPQPNIQDYHNDGDHPAHNGKFNHWKNEMSAQEYKLIFFAL